MGYDQSKDNLIKLYEMKKEKASILCSIFSYDNGQPKLGFSRSFDKKDGSIGYGVLGRMSLDEVYFLRDNINEIIHTMEEFNKK